MALPKIVPIWQYHAVQADGWRFMFSQDPGIGSGWTRDHVVWSAFATADSGGVPIYQYHAWQADGSGMRFTYSVGPAQGPGWTPDGVAWYGVDKAFRGAVPIYRYYVWQANGDGVRFTFSTDPTPGTGWKPDGVAFYCLPPGMGPAPDHGVRIDSPGNVGIRPHGAYNFGVGDFSVTALFQTTAPGTLVSRKSTEGGSPACAGWLVVLNPNGSFTFPTDNGYGYYVINSAPSSALDSHWHHVAAIRRAGHLEVWLDGIRLESRPAFTLRTPLNVTSHQRVLIGGTDQRQQPYNQFVGTIEDVTLWNCAIGAEQMAASMFNGLTGQESGLVGFWPMDRSFADRSRTGNAGSGNGQVSFVPVFHAVWLQAGRNAFSFASVGNPGTAGPVAHDAVAVGEAGAIVTRTQTVTVAPGAPYLFAGVFDPAMLRFPSGVRLSVTDPHGTAYEHDQDTPELYVRTQSGSTWYMVVRNPASGSWKATVAAPASAAFQLWFHTLPSADPVRTMLAELGPIHGYWQAPRTQDPALRSGESAEPEWPVWASVIGAIGLGGVAAIAACTPSLQGLAVWSGVGAALVISFGAAKLWGEDARVANLTPDQAAHQAAATAGFVGGRQVIPSVAQVCNRVTQKVGIPATIDPARFVSREDLGIGPDYRLHLDIGGEGPFTAYNTTCGFDDALNVNAQTHNSQLRTPIPMLVRLHPWSTNPPYPFQDGTVNYVTMQGAPLTAHNVREIARVLAPGGSVGLWIALRQRPEHGLPQTNLDRAVELATLLRSKVRISCAGSDDLPPGYTCDGGCVDEFKREYAFPLKVCIANLRES
jgi:hypothetical protein